MTWYCRVAPLHAGAKERLLRGFPHRMRRGLCGFGHGENGTLSLALADVAREIDGRTFLPSLLRHHKEK